MPELPVRFLPSVGVKTLFQIRSLSTGPGVIFVGWTMGYKARWESRQEAATCLTKGKAKISSMNMINCRTDLK